MAYGVSSKQPKQYESTAVVEIGSADLLSLFLAQSVQISDASPERLTAAAVELLNQPNVRDRASRAIGDLGSSADLTKAVKVTSVPDSSIIRVTARTGDPVKSRGFADGMAEAFLSYRIDKQRDQLRAAQRRVQDEYDALSRADKRAIGGQTLQQRLKDVGIAGALANGNADIVQGARTPTVAVAPRPKRLGALGLVAGVLLGLGIAVLRARLDDRVRDTEELTSLWELPIVGLVPQTSGLKNSGRSLPDPAALEALSLARTNLRYLHVGGTVKIVLVTSALEAEGKSTITWNLAVASALAKARVLVIEGDLRRPKITGRIGLTGPGLAEVLAGIARLDEAVQTVDIDDGSGARQASVDLLPAGLVPPSPIALLEGPETKTMFAQLRERYDVVLIDTPPATVVADAVALVDEVDGVIVVSRLGTVRRASYKRLREVLTAVNAPVLGQIINSDVAAKSYGYYSSYTEKPKRRQKA